MLWSDATDVRPRVWSMLLGLDGDVWPCAICRNSPCPERERALCSLIAAIA